MSSQKKKEKGEVQSGILAFCGKVLLVGGYWSGLCEKLTEVSSMSRRASASQLPDGPMTDPISDSGSISGVMYLGRGKNPLCSLRKKGEYV